MSSAIIFLNLELTGEEIFVTNPYTSGTHYVHLTKALAWKLGFFPSPDNFLSCWQTECSRSRNRLSCFHFGALGWVAETHGPLLERLSCSHSGALRWAAETQGTSPCSGACRASFSPPSRTCVLVHPEGAPAPLPGPVLQCQPHLLAQLAHLPLPPTQEHLSPPPLRASINGLPWCWRCPYTLDVSALTSPHHKQHSENHNHFHLVGKSDWGGERLVSKLPRLKSDSRPGWGLCTQALPSFRLSHAV